MLAFNAERACEHPSHREGHSLVGHVDMRFTACRREQRCGNICRLCLQLMGTSQGCTETGVWNDRTVLFRGRYPLPPRVAGGTGR
jgi:riboflavin synthase alpha subunit